MNIIVKKILLILTLAFLANLSFADLGFAVISPTPPQEVLIEPGELNLINKDKKIQECETTLSNRLYKVSDFGFMESGTGLWLENVTWLVARWDYTNNQCLIYQKQRINFATDAKIDSFEARGYKTEDITATGAYYLERTEYARMVENKLKNTSTKITVQNFNRTVGANTEATGASKVIGTILAKLIGLVTSAVLALTSMAGELMSWVIDEVTGAAQPLVVTTGWKIIRDIMNMIFILALIIMSLGTILRIEKYNYKKLLVKLVIMAILINFSKVIAESFIGLVDILIRIFAAQGNWTEFLSYAKNIAFYADFSSSKGFLSDLGLSITGLILALVMLVTFLAVALLLVIRTVGLWVLVILSPVAYALYILPGTEKWAQKWWETFIKYLIWAPVAVFFLRLGDIFIVEMRARLTSTKTNNPTFDFIFAMAFMWAAVYVAKQAGMVGGDMAIKGAKSVVTGKYGMKGAAQWGLGATDRWLGRGASSSSKLRRGLSYASVGAWKKGRKERSQKLEEEAYTVSGGMRANVLSKVFGGPRDFAKLAQYQRVAQERRRLENVVDKDELTAEVMQALNRKEWDKAMGGMMKLAAQGDLNEVLLAKGLTADAQGLQALINEIVTKSGNNTYMRMGAELSKTAENANWWVLAGAFKRNDDGSWSNRSEEDRRGYVNVQRAKASDQVNIRTLTRAGIGFKERVDENGVWYVEGITEDGLDYASRVKNIQEWRNNGNKNAKANVAISGSADWLRVNPEAWAVAANEYASTKLDDPDRLEQLHKSVAAPNPQRDYGTNRTVNATQARAYFNRFTGEERDKKIKDYSDLARLAGITPPGAAGTQPAPTATTPAATGGAATTATAATGRGGSSQPQSRFESTSGQAVVVENRAPHVQTATEVIREVRAPAGAHDAIREVSRQFHGGEQLDVGVIKDQLRNLGLSVEQASDAISSLAKRAADFRVNRVSDAAYNRTGIDMSEFKRVLKNFMSARHETGGEVNERVIVNTIRSQWPQVNSNDAQTIARQMFG
ncbi:MAG: hypothetical protein HY336_01400 [Candidatus Doudnabacteria bacterium]|nr:hypothetical protein [Candidatus Doudnabacteria bacterium]